MNSIWAPLFNQKVIHRFHMKTYHRSCICPEFRLLWNFAWIQVEYLSNINLVIPEFYWLNVSCQIFTFWLCPYLYYVNIKPTMYIIFYMISVFNFNNCRIWSKRAQWPVKVSGRLMWTTWHQIVVSQLDKIFSYILTQKCLATRL